MKYLIIALLFFACTKEPVPEMGKAKTFEVLVKGKHPKAKRHVKTKFTEFSVLDVTEVPEGAEINYTVKTHTWGQDNIGAPLVWESGNTGSTDVYIGVIDEGIMYFHPDLCNNVWVNPYDPKDGIDNDGNGYIDDVRGWDFMHNDNSIFDQKDNHGTHVAGTILGSTGVAKHGTLISAKFLEGSGSIENAIRAVDYFTDLRKRHGLNIVLNNSWGGDGYSQLMQDAINRAEAAGILFIASAGNDNKNIDLNPTYPASYPNVLTVGSIDQNEARSWFSNYGSKVDIYAPGNGIYSTVFVPYSPYWGYAYYSGTSMSSPHVTGAAVLYKSLYPSSTISELKNALLSSARTVNAMKLLDVRKFTGQVDSKPKVRECEPTVIDVQKPSTPVLKIASTTSSSITVTWDPLYDNTGVHIIRVRCIADDGSYDNTWNFWATYKSWTFSGLQNKLYRFRMVAEDKYGNVSDSSNIVWQSTVTQPPAETRSITLSGYASGKTHVLSWTTAGNFNSYVIYQNGANIGSTTSKTFTATGTKKNNSYKIIGDGVVTSNQINLRTR